jgi:two-component system chemotaxis response regulator CheY
MRMLIVDDDFTSRVLLREALKAFGTPDIAVNGTEAIAAARRAIEAGQPYDLICLDIMMPDIDGQAVLKHIRAMEEAAGIGRTERSKIVMTTALGDEGNVMRAIRSQCDGYLVKPYSKAGLLDHLRRFGLIE